MNAGRPGWHAKAEHVLRIDVRVWQRRGYLDIEPGDSSIWTWNDRESTQCRVEAGAVVLTHDLVGRRMVQRCPILRTACNFGGSRVCGSDAQDAHGAWRCCSLERRASAAALALSLPTRARAKTGWIACGERNGKLSAASGRITHVRPGCVARRTCGCWNESVSARESAARRSFSAGPRSQHGAARA